MWYWDACKEDLKCITYKWDLWHDADQVPDKWERAPENIDEAQYLRQVSGWKETYHTVSEALINEGPFDGILGFSQVSHMPHQFCRAIRPFMLLWSA